MHGAYNAHEAALDHNLHMLGLKTDSMLELTYTERKRVHNLKYYTWVEQQQMNVEDLNAQWYDTKNTWDAVHAQAKELDELINEFNEACFLHSLDEKFPGKAIIGLLNGFDGVCRPCAQHGVIGGQRRYLRILHIVHIAHLLCVMFCATFIMHYFAPKCNTLCMTNVLRGAYEEVQNSENTVIYQ